MEWSKTLDESKQAIFFGYFDQNNFFLYLFSISIAFNNLGLFYLIYYAAFDGLNIVVYDKK